MVDDNENTSTPFNRTGMLAQVQAELDKQRKESLKGKLKALTAKKEEALRAVAVVNKEIEEEFNKFESGL